MIAVGSPFVRRARKRRGKRIAILQPHHTRSWNAKLFRFMAISPWPRIKQTQVQMFKSESESGNLKMLSRRPERHKNKPVAFDLGAKDNALHLAPHKTADCNRPTVAGLS
jgi:hypothetical protein